MIDFHCHSNHSDGSDSVAELFQLAFERGIRKLALTDHDTVAGLSELAQLCANTSMDCINGIEFSTRWKKHDIHILGLRIDPHHAVLKESIHDQQKCRLERAKSIACVLEKQGLTDCWVKTQTIAGHLRIGRPHFAQLLVKEQWVRTVQQAFTLYLGRGKIAYIPTEWMTISEAVETISAAGGFAVLAHPLKYKLTRSKLCELIKHFKNAGGHALEVVSGDTSWNDINTMSMLCDSYNLHASSGSDYHGMLRSRLALGAQQSLPDTCSPVWTLWED